MKHLLASILIVCSMYGCKPSPWDVKRAAQLKYGAIHDKYRTLWYRSKQMYYYDSCRKYGLILDSLYGIKESDFEKIDTIPVNENP